MAKKNLAGVEMVLASLAERDRRWGNIRRQLEQIGLDGLIVVNDGHLERRGSMRYVADIGAPGMFGYVVLPKDGEPIAINVRGEWIKDIRIIPIRGGWFPESEPYAPVVAEAIKELNLNKSNIGIEGDFMPMPVYQRLEKELPRATFISSNIIHELKMVKSPEELERVEKGVEMVDKACETCFEVASPGKTWNEISSEVCKTLYEWGLEDIGGFPLPRSTSKIKPGDTYLFYPETQAPGGYWIQFGRLVSFGEPKKELKDAWELSIEAQKAGAEKLRPGNTGGDVMRAINDALKGTKYTGGDRGSGHGVGLDVLERPFISLDDETVLKPGMVMAVHPILTPLIETYVAIADTYIVTEDQPRKLSKIPPNIKVL